MKTLGKILLFSLLAFMFIMLTGYTVYIAITSGLELDESKLVNYEQTITLYDGDGNKIESAALSGNRSAVRINNLNDYTKNAFIASEDRKFYSHNGINFQRMIKAAFRNITSFSFKEGASTISQQLIKNTHLSNEKTLKRKLQEIRLTRKLEKKYSKDEILEMYLNTIYFGHNCYGLQNASRFYFGKDAENLTLAESATLAGLLASPNNYSPFSNQEKSLKRRNIVLKSMLECSFISENEYNTAKNEPITVNQDMNFNQNSDYLSAVYRELESLNLDCYSELSGCRVYTYMNEEMQSRAADEKEDCDIAIIITNSENGVEAYRNTIKGAQRQPGSTVKPLLVYAPAIEEGIICPLTKIEDKFTNFGGYKPQNYDDKYHGNVTVAESIKHSYNIPAVKTLNALTIEKSYEYAKKLHLPLTDEDRGLALALGGMKYGFDIKQICDAYSVFRSGGNYATSHFIKKIEDKNGRTIYTAQNAEKNKAFSSGTCSVINQMLIETSKEGTAKKLKNFNFDVASKTGTCGNEHGNTDAYAVSYTSDHTFCVWLGDKDNKKIQYTGGGECCNVMKNLITTRYSSYSPSPLDISSGTKEIYIDREDYDNDGKITIADDACPKLNRLSLRCQQNFCPVAKSNKFSYPEIVRPDILVSNDNICIELCQTKYYSYLIKRDNIVIYDDIWKDKIYDAPSYGSHVYSVTPYYFDGKDKHFGKTVTLDRVNFRSEPNDILPPDITKKDWFAE